MTRAQIDAMSVTELEHRASLAVPGSSARYYWLHQIECRGLTLSAVQRCTGGRIVIIVFGALAPSIKKQLREYKFQDGDLELWDRLSDHITALKIHGMLTDSETDKARRRLIKKIQLTGDRL